MNAVLLGTKAKALAIYLKISNKDAYAMLDIETSMLFNQVKVDLEKLDKFLQPGAKESTLECITRKYGDEATKFILSLV